MAEPPHTGAVNPLLSPGTFGTANMAGLASGVSNVINCDRSTSISAHLNPLQGRHQSQIVEKKTEQVKTGSYPYPILTSHLHDSNMFSQTSMIGGNHGNTLTHSPQVEVQVGEGLQPQITNSSSLMTSGQLNINNMPDCLPALPWLPFMLMNPALSVLQKTGMSEKQLGTFSVNNLSVHGQSVGMTSVQASYSGGSNSVTNLINSTPSYLVSSPYSPAVSVSSRTSLNPSLLNIHQPISLSEPWRTNWAVTEPAPNVTRISPQVNLDTVHTSLLTTDKVQCGADVRLVTQPIGCTTSCVNSPDLTAMFLENQRQDIKQLLDGCKLFQSYAEVRPSDTSVTSSLNIGSNSSTTSIGSQINLGSAVVNGTGGTSAEMTDLRFSTPSCSVDEVAGVEGSVKVGQVYEISAVHPSGQVSETLIPQTCSSDVSMATTELEGGIHGYHSDEKKPAKCSKLLDVVSSNSMTIDKSPVSSDTRPALLDSTTYTTDTGQPNISIVCSGDIDQSPPITNAEVCQCLIKVIKYFKSCSSIPRDYVELLQNMLQFVVKQDSCEGKMSEGSETVPTDCPLAEVAVSENNLEQSDDQDQQLEDDQVEINSSTTELVAPELVAPELVAPELLSPELISPELLSPELISPELISPELISPELPSVVNDSSSIQSASDCEHRCDTCDKKFNRLSNLRRHMKIHTGVKPYACTICSRRFSEASGVKTHMLTHTGDKPYKCTVCAKAFSMSTNLNVHMKFHNKVKSHKCKICPKAYSQSNDLRRHCLNAHGSRDPSLVLNSVDGANLQQYTKFRPVKKYTCSMCDKIFRRPKDLRRHMRIHTGERPYSCVKCAKAFSDPSALRAHSILHSGERPYKCSVCEKAFAQSSTLSTHMQIHGKERPFLCSLCGKNFKTAGYLGHHMLYHGERAFSCQVCSQGFVTPTDLARHHVVHTGEKPFKCHICGKGFGWERNRKVHIRNSHPQT